MPRARVSLGALVARDARWASRPAFRGCAQLWPGGLPAPDAGERGPASAPVPAGQPPLLRQRPAVERAGACLGVQAFPAAPARRG